MDWRHHRNRFVFYKHGWRRSSQHRSDAQSGYQFHRTWRTYANGRRYGVLHRLLRNYGGELFYRNARKLRLRYRRKWGVGKVYELPKRWGSVVLPIMCLSLAHAVCRVHLWFDFYNFCGFTRCCASLPRWRLGSSNHPWTVAELLGV